MANHEDNIPGEWHQWRGRVDTTLGNIEEDVDEIKSEQSDMHDTLNAMPEEIEKRFTNVVNGKTKPVPANPQNITWKDVVDKGWPFVIAIGMLLVGYLLRGEF